MRRYKRPAPGELKGPTASVSARAGSQGVGAFSEAELGRTEGGVGPLRMALQQGQSPLKPWLASAHVAASQARLCAQGQTLALREEPPPRHSEPTTSPLGAGGERLRSPRMPVLLCQMRCLGRRCIATSTPGSASATRASRSRPSGSVQPSGPTASRPACPALLSALDRGSGSVFA